VARRFEQNAGRAGLAVALAALVACGGGGGGGQKDAAPAAAPQAPPDGFAASWLGHLSKTYEGDLATCVEATKASLRKLDIDVTDTQGGIFETGLEAESRDGTSLVVVVKEVTKGTTRIAIKVGYLLGDRDAARRIHSEIEAELAARRAEVEARKRRWTSGSPAGGSP
jgi:hypothetical protein